MNITKYGVAYNFKTSPYVEEVKYNNYVLNFVFSSQNNRLRFKNKLKDNREYVTNSLTKRFKFNVCLDILSDLSLYSKVENRGFLIHEKEYSFECLEEVTFDGNRLTKKNFQE